MIQENGASMGETGFSKADAVPSRLVPLSLPLLVLFFFVLPLPPGRLPPWEGKDGYQHHRQPASARKRTPVLRMCGSPEKGSDWDHVLNNKLDRWLSPGNWHAHSVLIFWLLCPFLWGNTWPHMTDRSTRVTQSVLNHFLKTKEKWCSRKGGRGHEAGKEVFCFHDLKSLSSPSFFCRCCRHWKCKPVFPLEKKVRRHMKASRANVY